MKKYSENICHQLLAFLITSAFIMVAFLYGLSVIPLPSVVSTAEPIKTPSVVSTSSDVTNSMVRLTAPQVNAVITNPLVISGEAKSNWFFEASFPIRLLSSNGTVIANGIAEAKGDWMTEAFVPFSATLHFVTPPTGTGMLVLQKDNPSGLAKFDDTLIVPVRFTPLAK
ncbi:hypothetical protein COV04_01355 [Candidatus Uhrbacteria bacterium CG10_big_fil_rev_8_21_14_0_10_48_11]|uniref:Bacterial spore germination immunoglobulin-like domain-containing protein n=1 Tax=Candidatus Uhrbacteria bacterium CG10_big_fil_rev_8_21_14_0_10_48_11 TaxID=1975037 RepID=A0A2M8LFD8_9BACT|nr:MAG: hypothetical protein COV04_01355 [Candidatus Uhrbacteria bacterium CG10_big_fil_rev_8_21_14_0_10_48_11]